jgi:hypothetical protein
VIFRFPLCLPRGITVKKVDWNCPLPVGNQRDKTLSQEKFDVLKKPVLLGKNTRYCCSKCKCIFHTFNELIIHDSECIGPKVSHVCKYCDRSLSSAHALKMHIIRHEKEPKFFCSKCGKTFTNAESQQVHASEMHTEHFDAMLNGFRCRLCETRTATKTAIMRHVKQTHVVVCMRQLF